MQKLEEVLHAEDEARHAVTAARADADQTVRDAERDALAIAEDVRNRTAAEVSEIRTRMLDGAQREAEEARAASETQMKSQLAAARERIPQAVDAAVQHLLG